MVLRGSQAAVSSGIVPATQLAPELPAPPKFHEKTPRERKRAKMGAGEGKKRENLGLPPFRAPTRGALPPCGTHCSGPEDAADGFGFGRGRVESKRKKHR